MRTNGAPTRSCRHNADLAATPSVSPRHFSASQFSVEINPINSQISIEIIHFSDHFSLELCSEWSNWKYLN